MSVARALAVAGLPLLLAGGTVCLATSAQADATINVPVGDSAMVAAFAKARASLDDFLAKLEHPPAGTSRYSVKIGLKDGPALGGFSISRPGDGDNEFFWIIDLRPSASGFSGRIGNEPESVKNVREGQTISFVRDDIVDWMYFEAGKIKGNFTACPALAHGPREELELMRKRYGVDCG